MTAAQYPVTSAVAGGVSAAADFGISYGLNAKAASKAHDRSKNFATRHWQYEQIALKEAGINPGYIFAGKGGGPTGSAKMASQAHAAKGGGFAAAAEAAARIGLTQAQTEKTKAESIIIERNIPVATLQAQLAAWAIRQGKAFLGSATSAYDAGKMEAEARKKRGRQTKEFLRKTNFRESQMGRGGNSRLPPIHVPMGGPIP